ncbi:MAG: hypothetical protein AVDCRST_MAG20-1838, partial [uncultured Acidimicrobiales bacterium]
GASRPPASSSGGSSSTAGRRHPLARLPARRVVDPGPQGAPGPAAAVPHRPGRVAGLPPAHGHHRGPRGVPADVRPRGRPGAAPRRGGADDL